MDLSVQVWGDGDRRALLLHGISSNAAGWFRVGATMASWGYRVVAPDLRGHGKSPAADSYRLEDHADDVAALGTGWEVVLGHSMGAAVALLLAHDSFCRSLILEDPALVVVDSDMTRDWMLAPYRNEISAHAVAADNPTWHPEDARIKAEALLQSSPEMVERTLVDNPSWNVMKEVLAVEVPTLLLVADLASGGLVPMELGESIAAHNPAVVYRHIPGASHSMHRDQFDRTMREIGSWLGHGA